MRSKSFCFITNLDPQHAYIIDDETYNEIPVYIYTWWKYVRAKSEERRDITLKKYISKNMYGSQVFIDKNISSVFEPGSIFKSFTMAIGLDSDEVRLDDYYQDDGSIKIDIYTIRFFIYLHWYKIKIKSYILYMLFI